MTRSFAAALPSNSNDTSCKSDAAAVYIHPKAICETSQVGAATRIWAFAHVLDGAVIGRNCNIADHVFIEGGAQLGDGVVVKNGVLIWEGVTLEDGVFVGPGVVFTNDRHPRSRYLPETQHRYTNSKDWLQRTFVRKGAALGAGAVILCDLSIGAYASVAAGAIVTRDVPDHQLVAGQPARPIGWVCRCGLTLDDKLVCRHCRWQLHNTKK